ncbi:MAG: rhomboid family intramembrane serine protease [Bacteroides sp.]|nr:rhomboid family intramembrane serine protease [Bacteroides sp.]
MTTFINKFQRICDSRALAWLISLNCIIFVILWIIILSGNAMGMEGNFTMQWLCVPSSPSMFLGRCWTALTYMVTHYGILHLLFNMLWLFWFGRLLMTTLSDRHLLWLYIGGGAFGALIYIAGQATFPAVTGSAYLCGASASVLSVMTATAIRTPNLTMTLFLFGEVKLKWIAVACILLTFAGVGGGNTGGQAAHVGGVLFGAAFILAIKRGYDISKKFSEKPRQKMAKPRVNVKRDGKAVAEAASGRLGDPARLDELLDKIRMSGYQSLTAAERRELTALSQRLKGN